MNLNETRSSHPSSDQVETLVEFMERNPGMAKGFLRTQNARERSRRQWEQLAVRLNSIGGTIKNYKQWTKENETPSPSHEVQQIQDADTDNVHVPQQQQSLAPTEEPPAIAIYGSELIEATQSSNYRLPDPVPSRRRLFSSLSNSTVGTSQSILQNIQIEHTPPPDPHTYHPSLSPPPITLSHTPTPSPSRRGATQVASPVIRRRTAASSSSRHATLIASPSRRPRTNMARAIRGAASVSSRHTSSVAAPPPSQRRTEFSTTTERFLRVEEQQLEIRRQNAQILQSFLERSAERERAMDERSAEKDRILAEAVAAVGKGLQALAEAMNRDRV